MPQYREYPNATNTPKRDQRKRLRKEIFAQNQQANNRLRRERKLARKEHAE
jgi:hypothetical protein